MRGTLMRVCQNCGEKWSFLESWKKSWTMKDKTCNYCGRRQYDTVATKWLHGGMSVLTALLLIQMYEGTDISPFLIFPIGFLLFTVMTSSVTWLKNEREQI